MANGYSHWQSTDGIPGNVSHIYRDHNLKSTKRTRFQVDSVYERLWVVDIAPRKTLKTLGDRHVNGVSLVRHCTVNRSPCPRKRCAGSIACVYVLLILLELEFYRGPGNRGMWLRTGACRAIAHVSVKPSTGEVMTVGWAHRRFGLYMG